LVTLTGFVLYGTVQSLINVLSISYEKTKPLRLKLINYACVLALISSNYETDVHLIADDIGMTQKQ